MKIKNFADILYQNGGFRLDNKKIMFGENLIIMDFENFTAFDSNFNGTELSNEQITEISDYLLELWNNQDKSGIFLSAGDILLNGCDFDESWTLSEINAEIKNFYYNLRQIAKTLQDSKKIDKNKCKDYLFELFGEFDDYDHIKDRLRSLNSNNDLNDDEYDFCMENYENYLDEWLDLNPYGA